jgi:hemerythrin-like domain-containing protein
MCQYCGCRQVPLIRDYIEEHEQIVDAGDDAIRALDRGDVGHAHQSVSRMRDLLTSHWAGEEAGVFTVMSESDASYVEYIQVLVGEHRSLAAFLDVFDLAIPAHRERLRFEVAALGEHIAREEDGLFPATLTALSGSQWDRAIDAWQDAHPGEEMIED